jgi:cyclopropane fatty-acyl-phospholipid synthase-like methyltransferase
VKRSAWLAQQRQTVEEGYDKQEGTTYVEAEEISSTHRQFVTRLVELCPPDGRVLDAACGTGSYFGMILDAGLQVFGIDQSGGMLAQARERFPEVDTEKLGLQQLDKNAQFDAVMCVDAMEFVFPEDWSLVMANLRRALCPGGHLYLTVELVSEQELEKAFADATERGLPVVQGENVFRGGYHYYPPVPQVVAWVNEAGLQVVKDGHSDHGSYGYYHVLAVRAGDVRG